MKNLRIGVIGFGARKSIAQYAHQPEQSTLVTACADPSEAARQTFSETYGDDVFLTDDYRTLLQQDDLDAVFILSPDSLHEEQALTAIESGKAVFLEKPMAITVEGCDRILQAAAEKHARLYVGHNMRHNPIFRKMKELIDGGAIGEVKAGWCRHFVGYGGDYYFKDWHADRSKTTSLLLQKGAHDIDILHWLCGGYSRRVSAMGGLTLYGQVTDRHSPDEPGDARSNPAHWPPLSQKGMHPTMDVEDLSMMQMELDNGVFASYQQCHYTPDTWRNYTIIGTNGRIENFGNAPGNSVVRVWNRREMYNPYGDEQHFILPTEGGHGGSDPAIIAEFLRYAREGGEIAVLPLAAREAVATGCMATWSLRNGSQPAEVPPVNLGG